ncbi:S8 family serine peptidase [Nonomuraea sp. NPDC002799]
MPPNKRRNDRHTTPSPFPTERELVVIAKPAARLTTAASGAVASAGGMDITPLQDVVAAANVTMVPMFGSEEHLRATMAQETAPNLPDLSIFYRVLAPDDQLDALAERVMTAEVVETAYVKPGASPPVRTDEMVPEAKEGPPAHTPDFVTRQGYLDPAPGGVDARHAWTVPGGRGANVNIIDIEGAWQFGHEDLLVNQGGVVGGSPMTDLGWRNHGTAVVGEFGGDANAFGITGICPDANVRAVSIFGIGSAAALKTAADRLRPGDLIIIELHRPGPRHNFAARADQRGYIPIEWWEDDYQAIRYAVAKGIVVVSAAGNGAENLDDPLYSTRPPTFPVSWRNPFDRAARDSGTILVGAGAPPQGTHGRDHGPDRSRLDFSNWGTAVDTQGWGREVTTTGGLGDGSGDLQGGPAEIEWYTDRFSGTSSATPIVTGVLGSVQGALRAANRIPLTPARARAELRAGGSPQTDGPGMPRTQRIGHRPDLRAMLPRVLQAAPVWTGTQFTGTLGPGQTACWFTFNWPAHWHVLWTVVPTTPQPGAPQIRWRTRVERASDTYATYWICVSNLTQNQVGIEGRYAVLGW